MDIEQQLLEAYSRLVELKCLSTHKFDSECQLKDLTIKQIEYLKIIDAHEYITISTLAREVNNSKPTVTEMVKKFIAIDCVYKVKCNDDARKSYLKLTDRGVKISRMEQHVLEAVVAKMITKLSQEEIISLIYLLDKAVSD